VGRLGGVIREIDLWRRQPDAEALRRRAVEEKRGTDYHDAVMWRRGSDAGRAARRTAFLDDLSPSFTANKQYGQAPCNPQQAPEHLDADHSSLRHRRIPPRRRPAGLPSATPPDRRRRLRPDAECAGGVDGGAVGGDAADDILGGQNGL
jgi:hypothetical protein